MNTHSPTSNVRDLFFISILFICCWASNKWCFNCLKASSLSTNSCATTSTLVSLCGNCINGGGFHPYAASKGVVSVDPWKVVLYHNSTHDTQYDQVFGCYEAKHHKYASKHPFTTSVSRWYQELIFNVVPCNQNNSFQNRPMNTRSLSLTMDWGSHVVELPL